MAASVIYACLLNNLPEYVHISQDSDVDGSFLISAILGQRLRISNAGTLLVCLQHNYQHYFNAGMRLGYNPNIFLGKTLSVIDPLSAIATRDCHSSPWVADERQVCARLMTAIREQIAAKHAQRDSTVILIDNLSILFNLGATTDEVLQLCSNLAELPKEYEHLTVVTKMNNCEHYALAGNITKLSYLRIHVTKPPSGAAYRDMHGQLLVERDVVLHTDDVESIVMKRKVLYKINERNIKIFKFKVGEGGEESYEAVAAISPQSPQLLRSPQSAPKSELNTAAPAQKLEAI